MRRQVIRCYVRNMKQWGAWLYTRLLILIASVCISGNWRSGSNLATSLELFPDDFFHSAVMFYGSLLLTSQHLTIKPNFHSSFYSGNSGLTCHGGIGVLLGCFFFFSFSFLPFSPFFFQLAGFIC